MFKRIQPRASAALMAIAIVLAQVVMPVQAAFAYAPVDIPTDGQITICHSTQPNPSNGQGGGPQGNPYEQITVSLSAVDGAGGNDHTSHTGVVNGLPSHVFTPGALSWGDIIPAYGQYAGLNWTTAGQAIYYNECNIPTAPSQIANPDFTLTGACGIDNDTVTAIDTADYTASTPTWLNSRVSVTFTIKNGVNKVFSNGLKTIIITKAEADTTTCVVPPTVIDTPAVTVNPFCGVGTDTITYTETTADYTSSVAWNTAHTSATVTFTIKVGVNKVFAGNKTSVEVTVTELNTEKCPRTPTVCTLQNQTYDKSWTFGEETMPIIEEGAAATFTEKGLYLQTPQEASSTYGFIDAGNTPLVDIDKMAYRTFRDASSTGNPIHLPAYVLLVDRDGDLSTDDTTYLFYEPAYNGTVQTGVWQDWDVLDSGDSVWWSFDLTDGNPSLTWAQILADYPEAVAISYIFNQGSSNPGTNAYIAYMDFDCARTAFSGGKGTVPEVPTTPTTPTTPTAPTTPEAGKGSVVAPAVTELPETGTGSPLSVIIAILASVITYGALYFAQPKRLYE